MSKTICLIGKIASGKTTYANGLKAVLLSHDELALRLEDSCVGREAHVARAMGISEYFMHLAKQLNEQGLDVVLDYGFWTFKEREQLRSLAKALELNLELRYLDVSDEVRHQRALEREKQNGNQLAYHMDEEKLQRLDAFFEEPKQEEDVRFI